MNKEKRVKRFDWKSFISFGLLFSFIIMSITGIVLYITPPGRVAKWVIWKFMGLEKDEWQAIHTIFSYIFLIFGIFHTFSINWKAMLSYFKKRGKKGMNKRKELLFSSLLIIISFFGTIYKIPPFKTVMDFGEYLTESWENKKAEAPMPHTEAMSLTELSEKIIKSTPDKIMKKLIKNNIEVENIKQTLQEIAEKNKTTPVKIYKIITTGQEIKASSLKAGSGFGRKTLGEISTILKVNPEILLKRLKTADIEAKIDDRIRDIAGQAGKTPIEIIEILKKEEK